MSYNIQHLSTAGRATIFTALIGVVSFVFIFLFNIGEKEFQQAVAQDTASTSVTVLNTPPSFLVGAEEVIGSSTSTPTNAGDVISWRAVGVDANSEDYYLLICSENATPTPNGGGVPSCTGGTNIQWAVSALASSSATATAATTTTETTFTGTDFGPYNNWYAFLCDNNTSSQRCTGTDLLEQGSGTTASPFYVNDPPDFSLVGNDSPVNPGGTLTFSATSSDDDDYTAQDPTDVSDTVKVTVCATAGWATSTDTCLGTVLASSTFASADPDALAAISTPYPDASYNAYVYVIDNHGFEATSTYQGTSSPWVVNNVAPTVDSSTISLAQTGATSSNIYLTVEAGETTGFTLEFSVVDGNSCTSTVTGLSEISDYEVTLYRDDPTGLYDSNSSTTCDFSGSGVYDPNDCYTSQADTATWNLVCTASSTSCGGTNDSTLQYDCTFPLWYVADPTDGTATSTQFPNNDWKAQVRAIDDDYATGTPSEADTGVEVASFLAFNLLTAEIPYGSLEPGQSTDDLATSLGAPGNTASTTVQATGNVGLDELLSGEAMCPGYSGPGTECPNSSTSTVEDKFQVFTATSSIDYATASSSGNQLSSSTPKELEIDIPKSRATSTATSSVTYWGILIPSSITFSGGYTGQNTIIGKVGESSAW